ncbi:MAG TPA: CinA family protein [Candidatus Dormibacteraeota bacterium]|nr:CinA family protein [Candidatus Dormibacteraeota bacterium]
MATEAELIALAERLQARCLTLGVSVATAESCTGGLVGHLITGVAGSSGYFRGGVVAYSDAVKAALLAVPPAVLEAHGAVSAQVALAMAAGARGALRADLAVAVTGIAGPDGGTDSKPVGLTYVAVSATDGSEVRRAHWPGDRATNKLDSAELALTMLLEAATRLAGASRETEGSPATERLGESGPLGAAQAE